MSARTNTPASEHGERTNNAASAPRNIPFRRVLIANRGEIAVRVMRTVRALGIDTVAVYSDADADAPHVRLADRAVHIGPTPAQESYLDVSRIIAAARRAGADAIHPGYGFLSENPALPRACTAAGITFVGPTAEAIEAMGDKIRAKRTVAANGVSVVPGRDEAGLDDAQLRAAALDVGLPVLLKPSAGGGGKGMRLVTEPGRLVEEIAAARREALRSFGDDTLLVERYIRAPRHIEIQVIADEHGNVVHLGERECSLQRRHQKIIEESPSPFVTVEMRAEMGAQAVAAAVACRYTNVGTVELIVSGERPDEFFFMEMNTRLQVEHPVTEMVYGIDLVEWQLRIAAGESLPFRQHELVPRGHAVEARVYAEDPVHGFLPTGGRVVLLREPAGRGVRVDSGLCAGLAVGSDYDPMLAKVIAHGEDRPAALARLDAALGEVAVLGVTTNVDFLRRLLADPDVAAGRLDTELVERSFATVPAEPVPDDAVAAAVIRSLSSPATDDVWGTTDGWRLGGRAQLTVRVEIDGTVVGVTVQRTSIGWLAAIGDDQPFAIEVRDAGEEVVTTVDGIDRRYLVADDGEQTWLGTDGAAWAMRVRQRWRSARPGAARETDGLLVSPMPGKVIDVRVAVGDVVVAGQTLATVEAMKMEHPLRSRIDGVVADVQARVGQPVALGDPIVRVMPVEASDGTPPNAARR